jgi:hypothetical protein
MNRSEPLREFDDAPNCFWSHDFKHYQQPAER